MTQQFNTTTSMGRLTLNMLLSFAQFEREIAGERIHNKIAASKKKGMWMGGNVCSAPFQWMAQFVNGFTGQGTPVLRSEMMVRSIIRHQERLLQATGT